MGEKIVIGPINRGLRNDVTAFNIDNDSFPFLLNAYQWRGRVKRKRGTEFLGRLTRFFDSTSISYNSGSTTITLNGSGVGNLLTGFSLEANGNIVPGSVTITQAAPPVVYTDPSMDGNLSPSGTINYATGVVTIAASAGNTVSATFLYTPDLPVMGLEELTLGINFFPGTLAFDTTYSYNILTASPYSIYDVSFYKNPTTATYVGYTEKTNITPVTWNGQDYQQFYTVNYQGALWATNGVNVPFSATNVGMQYKPITGVTIGAAGPPAIATLTIVAHGLVQGDFVFINEVGGITGINFQTGYVVSADPQAANTVDVEFPNAILGGAYTSGGIAQYLTNRSDVTKDCIRWYDGDPTDANPVTPTLNGHKGWVNFAPPLSQLDFSIADLPADQYYLAGAKMVFPFKDRLLFFGPVVQTSAAGSQRYLQDTVIFSQNGTPYYTASFSGDPISPDTAPPIIPILVPENQTASPTAWWEDQTGFGGFITAGIDQAINTLSPNEDVLILGFDRLQSRFVYTGNDIIPFNFFIINSELGSGSTFSTINMDKGVITRGSRGIIITGQTESKRIDLDIPDQVFEFKLTNNGPERVTAQRDFINEWLYITYLQGDVTYNFPNQTLIYNYRDNSWAIFDESYTTYGQFRRQTGYIWSTVGLIYSTWESWNDPWDSGENTLLQPEIIGGNQQGFVIVKDKGTDEGNSLYITSISTNTITSPSHNLNQGDYIYITGVIGTVGYELNGKTFSVSVTGTNTFTLNPPILGTGTYFGGGLIKRLFVPYIQTKQFPVGWELSRKTRLGVQQYLLTKTSNSQIQLLIFLSQNDSSPYNEGRVVPEIGVVNDSLIYSSILYTCPESTNLGLLASNTNLQTPTASAQQQIWHRVNTSLLGDTVQLGFTMSDNQMRDLIPSEFSVTITGATQSNPCILSCKGGFNANQLIKITGVDGMTQLNGNTYSVISSTSSTVTINVDSTAFSQYISSGIATLFSPSAITGATAASPCVLSCTGQFVENQLITITDIVGMVELNDNTYSVISSSPTTVTIGVDSTLFTAYISGGIATPVSNVNHFAEIELHSIILDVTPSQVLA